MASTTAGPVFPDLIPNPKSIAVLEGDMELSDDVRLVTSNVLPMQRKAMRGILTGAGIRVVANKKKYVIEAKVEPRENFDLSDVPEHARDEYYELELRDTKVYVRTPSQYGALWGTQTFAAICRAAKQGTRVPNLVIRDWPSLPNRGIFVENKWGPDRMDLTDWCLLIDRLSVLKMNRLGIGLYGCWGNCRFEGTPTEFLMVPVPDHDEIKAEKHVRWFSPDDDEWHDETYLPDLFEEDFLGEVVAYGREKGVTVIPFVNSLGHNTFLPRMMPGVSAKAEDGSPLGIGYCLSSDQTREFLASFYGSIIERYFPQGCDFFHIEMDEVWADHPDPEDPHKRVEPWCQCDTCRARPREENLREYVLWLVSTLTDMGVGKVVMWNDQLTRHMDVLDESFAAMLAEKGLEDRLILHWWWYSNETLNDRTRVAIGREIGLDGWVAPMTCYFNWQRYDVRRENIGRMMGMAFEDGAVGAVSYAVHDPSHADHEALLAEFAWRGCAGVEDVPEALGRWASRFGDPGREQCLNGLQALAGAAATPALGLCYHYTYTYCREGLPFPREYPGEALDKLEEREHAAAELVTAREQATTAKQAFVAMLEDKELTGDDRECIESLLAEADRIVALTTVFGTLLDVRAGGADSAAVTEARAVLLAGMSSVEENKPDWVVPASLQSLSVLLEFLDQLIQDLDAGADMRWSRT